MSGRSCGSCNLCCKVLDIDELHKPAGVLCEHARAGDGCAIHGSHPATCRAFSCHWLLDPRMPDVWKPSTSGFVTFVVEGGRTVSLAVDPAYPEAWRRAPYYEVIKSWSGRISAGGPRVIVTAGDRTWVVFPEEDLLVGEVGPLDAVASGYVVNGDRMTPTAIVRRDGVETTYAGRETGFRR